jgi:hypothetical protein
MQLPFNYLSVCISQLTKKTPFPLHKECNVQQKQEEMQKRNPFVSQTEKLTLKTLSPMISNATFENSDSMSITLCEG